MYLYTHISKYRYIYLFYKFPTYFLTRGIIIDNIIHFNGFEIGQVEYFHEDPRNPLKLSST